MIRTILPDLRAIRSERVVRVMHIDKVQEGGKGIFVIRGDFDSIFSGRSRRRRHDLLLGRLRLFNLRS